MLNEESRKYFNRAFAFSSSALNYYALHEQNHLDRMQQYLNIQDNQHLIEYLKTVSSVTLSKILRTSDLGQFLLETAWVPTTESANNKEPFITKTPAEIYESDEAPIIDTMFSFTSQVFESNEFYNIQHKILFSMIFSSLIRNTCRSI